VDNDVEKCHLTARKASNGAAFNKMLFSQAIFKCNRINDLQKHLQTERGTILPTEKIFSKAIVRDKIGAPRRADRIL
jgi:hypothetical protein